MTKITAKSIVAMGEMSQPARMEVARRSFIHFFSYYLFHYCRNNFSQFHYDMCADVEGLAQGRLSEAAEVTYRGSSKTSLAKGFVIWCIVEKHYEYINVDSFDGANSERFLFDVVLELQTNAKLTDDYGHLFNTNRSDREVTQKRVKDFLTTNGVRVEAHTTQEPVRGRLHKSIRPQLIVFDDIEVKKTVRSEAMTRQVREHIQEAKPGMDPTRNSILWLGNYISEYGNIQLLMDRLKDRTDAVVRLVPLINEENEIAWPQRFVMTDEEAEKTGKVSIEKVKRDMWNPDTGDSDFNLEMLCDPRADASKVFNRSMFLPVTMEDIKRLRHMVYFTVDPGGSGDNDDLTNKDPAGFCINWMTPDGFWNLKAWGEKVGSTGLIARIIDTMEWLEKNGTPCHSFAWEKNQYTNALLPQLMESMRDRNRMFPVIELPHNRSKEERVKGSLLNRYETGRIRHLDGECDILQDELILFPYGEHDDVADAAAMQAEVVPMAHARPMSNSDEPPISKHIR